MIEDEVLERVRTFMNVPDGRMQEISGYEGERVGEPLTGRQGTFHRDFYKGYRGESMTEALSEYTWSNLGWRLGVILRAATGGDLSRDEQKEIASLLFDMLSHLHAETIPPKHEDRNCCK